MQLDNKDFKRMKALDKLVKDGKATEAEKAECEALHAKKNSKGSNDLAWWKNYSNLLKDVTNIPFNWIPGTKVYIQNDQGVRDELELGNLAIAHFLPTIGRCTDAASPFNVQIRQLWLDLHRKYRGIGTYQQSDLGIAILAIESFFMTLAKFERIYGTINTYHIGNRVVPYGLLEALKIDKSLGENLADFRYTLNLYIEKAKQLCLPKGLSVLESDIVAISNLFKDSGNRRAFIFGFDTDIYGVYDPKTLTTGGCVKYIDAGYAHMGGATPAGESAYTLPDIEDILNEQLNALITDDDIARICSDLLAAYGQENVMGITNVPEDYKVEPIHDYERQLQFHNLTICGLSGGIYDSSVLSASSATTAFSSGVRNIIYQNDDNVVSRVGKAGSDYATAGSYSFPTYAAENNAQQGKVGDVLFDTWVDEPGEAEIMCGTRYTTAVDTPVLVTSGKWRQEYASFGTAIIETVSVYWLSGTTFAEASISGSVIEESNFKTNIYAFMKMMQMDWHPTFFMADSGDYELFGDVDNFAIISTPNLARLHEVALLSGYKIPMVSGPSDK